MKSFHERYDEVLDDIQKHFAKEGHSIKYSADWIARLQTRNDGLKEQIVDYKKLIDSVLKHNTDLIDRRESREVEIEEKLEEYEKMKQLIAVIHNQCHTWNGINLLK